MLYTNKRVVPKVGDYIRGDEWHRIERKELLESDGYSDSSYRGCDYRYHTHGYNIGVDIVVTGGCHYDDWGDGYKSRIKIIVVGDGEPDKSFNGWLYHNHLPEEV